MEQLNMGQIVGEVSKAHTMSKSELAAHADQKFRKLVRHANEHSSFYRKAFAGLDIENAPLEDFPVLTKQIMMENFDDLVTDPVLKLDKLNAWLDDISTLAKLYDDRWIVSRTSGSTGFPAIIVAKPSDLMWWQAASSLRAPAASPTPFQVFKARFKPWRIALINLITGRGSSGYVAALHQPKPPRFVKKKFFSILDPLDKLVADLNEYQPVAIFALASFIDTLAEEQLAGRLKLKLNAPISMIGVGGDTLHPTTREKAKAAWGIDIMNTYGATECGVVAKSFCDFEHLHINSDLCHVEIVDANNRPVPYGTQGAGILVTNFHNFSQPLIRYRLDDVACIREGHEGCDLPFPILDNIDGRTDDCFLVEEDNGTMHLLRPFTFLAFDIAGVKRFQCVQTGRNAFEVRYIAEVGHSAADLEAQLKKVHERIDLPTPVTVIFKQVDDLKMTSGGKFRIFLNHYHDNPQKTFLESKKGS